MSKPYRSTEEGAWARVRELEELNARLKRRITDMIEDPNNRNRNYHPYVFFLALIGWLGVIGLFDLAAAKRDAGARCEEAAAASCAPWVHRDSSR